MLARIRRVVVIAFALVLFGAGGIGWYLYVHFTDPETVRRLSLEWIRQKIPNAHVELDSAAGTLTGGFCLKQFSLACKDGDPGRELIRLAQLTLLPDRNRLLEGDIQIKKAVLDRPVFKFHRDANGEWDFVQLLNPKPFETDHASVVEINDARLLLTFAEGPLPAVELQGINLEVQILPPSNITFSATCHHACSEQIRITGHGDLAKKQLHVDVWTASPVKLQQMGKFLGGSAGGLWGLADVAGLLDLRLTGDIRRGPKGFEWDGALVGDTKAASFAHPLLPYPVKDAEARFTASRKGLEVSSVKLSLGPARGEFSALLPEWNIEKFEGAGSVWGIPFNDAVYSLLPQKHQQMWEKFSPEGEIDLQGKVRYVDGRWQAQGSADLNDNAATFYLFPYRVEKIKGRIVLDGEGQVSVEARGMAGNRPVRASGKIFGLSAGAPVDIELSGQSIPLDNRLRMALSEKAAKIFDKFAGVGEGSFVAKVKRAEGETKIGVGIEADVNLAQCRCAWFPYRVDNVTGHLSIAPYKVVFSRFMGTSGGAAIQVDGQSIETTDGSHVEVYVRGQNVPLDDKLQAALPDTWQQSWESLQPEGKVDLWVTVINPPGMPLDLRLKLDPAQAAITPVAFPYRLHSFQGLVDYSDKKVTWENALARHGNVELSCSGEVEMVDGGGLLTLTGLRCPRLPFDRDLHQALPAALRPVIDFLAPNRPVAANFRELTLRWWNGGQRSPDFTYEGAIGFEETNLIPAVGAQNVTGTVTIAGQYSDEKRTIAGNVDLAAITVASLTARNVVARLEGVGTELNLDISHGDLYGGKLQGRILGSYGDVPAYECRLTAIDSRLSQFVRERMPDPPTIDGLVYTDLFLTGSGDQMSKLNGRGRVDIRDADLYRLPVIMDMFQVLNRQVPDGRVFDTVNCNFRFQDRRLLIDKLDLIGPAVSLLSEQDGQMNLDNLNLDVRLRPRWAQGKLNIPLVTGVFNMASDQLILIRLKGKLTSPVPISEPVPGLRRMFQGPPRISNNPGR